jgi:DNA-binding CsgD family transcriptional regulator
MSTVCCLAKADTEVHRCHLTARLAGGRTSDDRRPGVGDVLIRSRPRRLGCKVRGMGEQMISFLHAEAAQTRGRDGLEVIQGGPAVFARIKQVGAVTRSEMLSLEPPETHVLPEQEEREAYSLVRGLARRGVHLPSAMSERLEARPDAPFIRELAAAGSPTRYSPSVPMRVLVFDRRVAFFALDAHDPRHGAYMTTASTLVQLVCRLFDEVWQQALPIPGLDIPTGRGSTVDEQRQRLLELLAHGYTDERIARHMAVSIRTIGRAVAQLQTELGAQSRFQLALLAQQAGLITHRPTNPPATAAVNNQTAQLERHDTEPREPAAR